MPDTPDDDIENLFVDAIETFPAELQEAARDWLSKRDAAYRLIKEIEEKGLFAALDITGEERGGNA